MKAIVIILLAAIVASLFSALFQMSKSDPNSPAVLKALKIRVALSAVLVVFLVTSYFMGWIQP